MSSRDRADPQLGTAPQARRWLLIESRGPWQIDALAGSGLSADLLGRINRAAHAHQARPLLIRRPGRVDPSRPRAWAVTYAEGSTQWGTWATEADLGAAIDALTLPEPPTTAVADPILLVCTHGLHDVCCALRGRPVAAALARQWPDATWECSHVGGDRFAANLVVLPDGVYYGNLDAGSAVETVRTHLGGTVPVQFLRGMSRVPPAAQVGIAAVHELYGPFGAHDVEVEALDHTGPGHWELTLRVPRTGLAAQVTVTSTRRAPAQLTCRAASETPAAEYHVLSLTVG